MQGPPFGLPTYKKSYQLGVLATPVQIRTDPLNFRFETHISRAVNLFPMVWVRGSKGRGAKYVQLLEDPAVLRQRARVAINARPEKSIRVAAIADLPCCASARAGIYLTI